MRYGRTIIELFLAQALILTALMVVPADTVASISGATAGLLTSAIACTVASAVYLRHRGRTAARFVPAPAEARQLEGRVSARRVTA